MVELNKEETEKNREREKIGLLIRKLLDNNGMESYGIFNGRKEWDSSFLCNVFKKRDNMYTIFRKRFFRCETIAIIYFFETNIYIDGPKWLYDKLKKGLKYFEKKIHKNVKYNIKNNPLKGITF